MKFSSVKITIKSASTLQAISLLTASMSMYSKLAAVKVFTVFTICAYVCLYNSEHAGGPRILHFKM